MKDNDCRTKPRARTTGTPGDRTGPSLDTLDSFVVPVVCQNCMVVCEDNGYCPVCCQYETLDGHNKVLSVNPAPARDGREGE